MGSSGATNTGQASIVKGHDVTTPYQPIISYGFVYIIRNTVNRKVYVGQTTQRLKARWSKHRSDSTRSSNCRIHLAMHKHGIHRFEIQEICECPSAASLSEAERFFIWILGATKKSMGYNLTYGGEGVFGTPETRRKQSEALKGHAVSDVTRKKISDAAKQRYAAHPRVGRPMSAEQKEKLSISMGKKMPPRSDQHRQRLAAAGRSRVWTDEAKQKIGAAHKGLRHTEEARRKMSASRQGKPSSMLGKLHSAETKLKMSVAHKGQISVMRGKRHSEETKRKMSESHKQRILTNKGESHASS